jgi:Arc/MetJ-type ribon-helix-helix transcriptional regulator
VCCLSDGGSCVTACSLWDMEQITLRLPESLREELEQEADERGVSRSEHIRDVLESRRDTERLRERLESRERRIEELEEQLARRSQIEEKVDVLAERVDEEPPVPWPVRWYRWFRD